MVKVFVEKFDDFFEPTTKEFTNELLNLNEYTKERYKKNDSLVFTIEIYINNNIDIYEIYIDKEKIMIFSDIQYFNIDKEIRNLIHNYIIDNKTLKEIENKLKNDIENIIHNKITEEEKIWNSIKKHLIFKFV